MVKKSLSAVSFDVLADNKTLHKKQFTFSTGDVNY